MISRTILLTKREARVLLFMAENSGSDPDWWASWGKGTEGAYSRAVEKLRRQVALREPGDSKKRGER